MHKKKTHITNEDKNCLDSALDVHLVIIMQMTPMTKENLLKKNKV